ncbi:MAG: flagellar type III secretion system protein FliR [Syntrophomonadaceae bacterium]|nr:flagellar type III secretion system protein FliR [Syntrophomonadaceae bacterium]
MEIIDLLFNKIDLFLVVLARVSGVFQIAPIFAGERTPIYIRTGLAAIFSILIAMVLPVSLDPIPQQLLPFILGMAGEFILGFAIGFIIYLVFVAVQVAGQFIDMQMGFGIVNVLDPQSGIQMPLVGNFLYIIALLVFLSVNGHHLILTALVKSYDFIPVMGFTYESGLTEIIIILFCGMFLTAMKIAVPVVITLVVTDIALGLVARTVPQMNVFIVGLPMKIMVGIFSLITIMSIYVWVMTTLFSQVFDNVDLLFRLLSN